MSLPSSGPISISAINTELGRTSNSANTSLTTLESGGYVTLRSNANPKPNGSTPNSLSEWYGYIHANSQSGLFGSGANLSDACNIDITLYWPEGVSFGPGVTMYTDSAMTTPLTGENYISQSGVGEIYNINPTTGVVGSSTGNFC